MRANRQGSAYRWGVGLLVVAMGLGIAAIPPSPAAEAEPLSVKTGQIALESATDLVVDADAGLVYVSQFATKEIKVIDLATVDVVDTFVLYGKPVGLELSSDGADLYVALYSKGKVLVLDAATGIPGRNYDVTDQLGTPYTWALQRVGVKLFVAGTSVDGEQSHLAEVDLLTHATRRVGGEETTGDRPSFAWDGADALHVGDANGRVVSLVLSDPAVPASGNVYIGHRNGRMAATPSAIFTDDGDVRDPSNPVAVLARIVQGHPARSDSGERFFVAEEPWPTRLRPIRVFHYEADTLERSVTTMTRCRIPTVVGFEVLSNEAGFLILGPEALCVVASVATRVGTCGGLVPTFVGTPKNDVIFATDEADVIVGLGGDDRIYSRLGDDIVCGGEGSDMVNASRGDDQLFGGAGDNFLDGGPDNDLIKGGAGVDAAVFADSSGPGIGFDHVEVDLALGVATGAGDDVLVGIENLTGSNGPDVLLGDSGPNVILGKHGRDEIRGRGGNDIVSGGLSYDHVMGNAGDDIVKGGDADDRLSGGYGVDTLYGGFSDDDIVDLSHSP